MEDSLRVAQKLSARGISSIINYLGEDLTDPKDVEETLLQYERLIGKANRAAKIQISVKPSQLGLMIAPNILRKNYGTLLKLARRKGIFVWLDMEEKEHVQDTIELYLPMVKESNAGICIQAYLKRSHGDVVSLVRKGARIRLVKGAYTKDADYSREKTTENYEQIMDYLFSHSKLQFMIATHDAKLIEKAIELEKRYKKRAWFAMLNGIRPNYAAKLASGGEEMYVYVPYGRRWFQFAYRRLTEAGHIWIIIRSLFGG